MWYGWTNYLKGTLLLLAVKTLQLLKGHSRRWQASHINALLNILKSEFKILWVQFPFNSVTLDQWLGSLSAVVLHGVVTTVCGCCCSEMIIYFNSSLYVCLCFLVLEIVDMTLPPNSDSHVSAIQTGFQIRDKPAAMHLCWNVPGWIVLSIYVLLGTNIQHSEMLVVWSLISCKALLISISNSKITIMWSSPRDWLLPFSTLLHHDESHSLW